MSAVGANGIGENCIAGSSSSTRTIPEISPTAAEACSARSMDTPACMNPRITSPGSGMPSVSSSRPSCSSAMAGGGSGAACLARTHGSAEFTRHEMQTLEAIQPVFSAAWCASLPQQEECLLTLALSPRERQGADDALAGRSNADICRALGIAMPTTKHHLRSILAKTGTANRRELLSTFYQRRACAPRRQRAELARIESAQEQPDTADLPHLRTSPG